LELGIFLMFVLFNGRFVEEAEARVSVFDRGFLYGDGLFETIRVHRGAPFLWARHMERLRLGAGLLKLRLPFHGDLYRAWVNGLVERNQLPEAILRIHVTRGVGPRGYSPGGADAPTLVMSLHPAPAVDPANPPLWSLITSRMRVVENDPLALPKTSDKLRQVLARMEAKESGADEALLLNHRGEIAEAAGANVFWVQAGGVVTPPLQSGALAGVTRALMSELCESLGFKIAERNITPEQLQHAEGVFLTNSVQGVMEMVSLDGRPLERSPLTAQLHAAWWGLLERETQAALPGGGASA
jgi:branched-chain amino acid aminotransferase